MFFPFLHCFTYVLNWRMQTPDAADDPPEEPELPFATPLSRTEQPLLPDEENPFAFDHVRLRFRHDGWTPERQERFIEALAATGCVEDAARAVGKSVSSAYALKTRAEAQPFRLAWEAALEVGIKRLSEAALSRAIHGVPRPIYYQGQHVGERRHYDERLTMFLLRYRDPARYGPWIDRAESVEEKPDAAALLLRKMLNRLIDELFGEKGEGKPRSNCDADTGDEEEGDEDEDWDEKADEEEGEEEITQNDDVIPKPTDDCPEEDSVHGITPVSQGTEGPSVQNTPFNEMLSDTQPCPRIRGF